MGVCFSAGDCLLQEIKAPNSITELEGMSGVLSSPGARASWSRLLRAVSLKIVSPRTETPNGLHSPGNLFHV